MDLILNEEYSEDIVKKLSIKRAFGITMWVLSILLCVFGMGIILVGGVLGVLALEYAQNSVEMPINQAGVLVVDLADTLSALEGNGEYLATTKNMSLSLRDMADSMDGISVTFSGLQNIPLVGSQFAGLSSAGEKMGESAIKMRISADSLEESSSNIEGAILGLAKVEADLRTEAKALESAKTGVGSFILLAQIAIIGFTLGLECLMCGCICLALSYGPPVKEKDEEKKKREKKEKE